MMCVEDVVTEEKWWVDADPNFEDLEEKTVLWNRTLYDHYIVPCIKSLN